jgi:uncharacterized protein (AIM24 family)
MANVINATSTGNGGLITTGDDSGILNIQTNETTAITVDASQIVSYTNNLGTVAGYPAYQCRAWVNFNGTGTVAIRGSGNVSSITDNGVGSYTINFTNSLPNANYSVCGNGLDAGNGIVFQITSTATGNVRVQLTNAAIAAYDSSIVTASIFSS